MYQLSNDNRQLSVRWGGNTLANFDEISVTVKYTNAQGSPREIPANLSNIKIRRINDFSISGPGQIQRCCLLPVWYQAAGFADWHGSSGYSFEWNIPSGWSILQNSGSAIQVLPDNTTGGQVSCTISRQDNTCPKSSSVGIQRVQPVFSIQESQVPIGLCEGQTASINASFPCNFLNATWTAPPGWIITSGQGTPNVTILAGPGAQSGFLTLGGSVNGNCSTSGSSRPLVLIQNIPVVPDWVVLPPSIPDRPVVNWINGHWNVCPEGIGTVIEVYDSEWADTYTFSVTPPWRINGQTGPVTTTNPWVTVSGVPHAPWNGTLTVFATNCFGSSATNSYTFLRNNGNIPCFGRGFGDERNISTLAHPNPFDHFLIIQAPEEKVDHLVLSHISGKIMMQFSPSEFLVKKHIVDTREWPSGFYVLSIMCDGKIKSTHKYLKL